MRKLASVQRIKHIRPIEGADSIECVGVLGWECVAKKGEFQEGDTCVYFEIDSLLPEEDRYEFLRKSSYKPDLKGFRLKTVRLKGQISQGLALPLDFFPDIRDFDLGQDVTELLQVRKYEPPVPAQIAGDARSFSWPIAKTDETRVQQNDEYGFLERLSGRPYYISLKLDGTSCSFIIDPNDGEYHVCGRNYSYKKNPDHSFWKLDEIYGIEEKLRSLGGHISIQGEVVGPGVQKNRMGLKSCDFYVFNVVDSRWGRRLPLDEATSVTADLGLKFVPILERGDSFSYPQRELLEKAKGRYRDYFPAAREDQHMEGIVIRSLCGSISFKAINNDFLLGDK
jgi:RNA ligase (TIGR02306 family)